MTSLLTKYVSERQRKGDFVTVWTPLTTLTVHWLSPLLLMSMCIKMKNALMAEYGLESDSALTDDGMNKLIIKGLITPLQMHLHTCAHTECERETSVVQCHECVCHHNQHFGLKSPF